MRKSEVVVVEGDHQHIEARAWRTREAPAEKAAIESPTGKCTRESKRRGRRGPPCYQSINQLVRLASASTWQSDHLNNDSTSHQSTLQCHEEVEAVVEEAEEAEEEAEDRSRL